MSAQQSYSVQRATVDGIEVVRLIDAAHHMQVSIAPSIGNIAYEFSVNGQNLLWCPFTSLAEFKAHPTLCGIPFLGPWANRIDGDAYWANGKKYLLNSNLGNIRRDPNGLPIHGLLSFVPDWQVTKLNAEDSAAVVTSRLEFWRHPEWMAQFPFAHQIEMTYRLSNGALHVELAIENMSIEPMPLSVGFHPYYQIPNVPRDDWKVHLAVSRHYELSPQLIPTGQTTPVNLPDPTPLSGHQLDDVFAVKQNAGPFWVEGNGRRITIDYGPNYPVAVVYAPPGRPFICFEPMSGVTDAFNLAHAGKYDALPSVPARGRWQAEFSVTPSGF